MDFKEIRGHLDSIIKAKINNNLAIFVGSGISKGADDRFRLWDEIIEELKGNLKGCSETDYLKIAELYHIKHGQKAYNDKVKSFLPNNPNPSDVHKAILDLRPSVIITTNWDNLLEKTIRDGVYIYSTIACDEDLSNSFSPKKLIKMHGDFNHHNFVFKESDYINYQENFPLIENYIKSILSTHTVLFLGYSFSDYNLKQIISWIEHRTKTMPSLYMLSADLDEWKVEYLKKKHLIPIEIPNNEVDAFLSLVNSEIFPEEYDSPEKFILSKIRKFNSYNTIFYRDIEEALCSYRLTGHEHYFYLPVDFMYFGKDPKSENLKKQFILDLNEFKEKKKEISIEYMDIFTMLLKANILGFYWYGSNNKQDEFIITDIFIQKESLLEATNKYIDKYLSFDLSITENDIHNKLYLATISYDKKDYKNAKNLLENCIKEFLQKGDYKNAFVAIFNYNKVFPIYKRLESIRIQFENFKRNKDRKNNNKDNSKKIERVEYNLELMKNEISREYLEKISSIYSFIDSSMTKKELFNILSILNEKEVDAWKIRTYNTSVFNDSPDIYKAYQKSLMDFAISHNIIVDFPEISLLNQGCIKISISRAINGKISLNKYEIFAAIKYLNFDELKMLFSGCLPNKNKDIINTLEIDHNWILKIFSNLIKEYKNSNKFSYLDEYIQKVLFLISLLNLNNEKIKKIYKEIISLIKEKNVNLQFIKGINIFIKNKKAISLTKINDINEVFEIFSILLKKFADNLSIIESLHFISYYTTLNPLLFKDENLINQVIKNIDEIPNNLEFQKFRIIHNLIFPIWIISNKKVQKIIEYYLTKTFPSDKTSNIVYQLNLLNLMNLLNSPKRRFTKKSISNINSIIDIDHITNIIEKYGKVPNNYDIISIYNVLNNISKELEKRSSSRVFGRDECLNRINNIINKLAEVKKNNPYVNDSSI